MRSTLHLVAVGLAAFAGVIAASDFVTVTLQATPRTAGQVGRAFLIPQGGATRVQIEVSGVPPLVASRPVHLYTYVYTGRCERRAAEPAFALVERVLAQSPSGAGIAPARGPFVVSNDAPLPLDRLRAGPYAVVVRTSPADGNADLFCGDIPAL